MERMIHLRDGSVTVRSMQRDDLPHVAAFGSEPALWEFTFARNPFLQPEATAAWLEEALDESTYRTFVIIDERTNEIVGCTRFHDFAPPHRRVEIGWTFVAKHRWRSDINTRAKRLLFEYAFNVWGANRVYLKANGNNARSRSAILRLGATYEGTLRSMRLRESDNTFHDISYYSVLRGEWPAVKRHLDDLLDRAAAGVVVQ